MAGYEATNQEMMPIQSICASINLGLGHLLYMHDALLEMLGPIQSNQQSLAAPSSPLRCVCPLFDRVRLSFPFIDSVICGHRGPGPFDRASPRSPGRLSGPKTASSVQQSESPRGKTPFPVRLSPVYVEGLAGVYKDGKDKPAA